MAKNLFQIHRGPRRRSSELIDLPLTFRETVEDWGEGMKSRRIVELAAVLIVTSCVAFATPEAGPESSSVKKTLELLMQVNNADEIDALAKLYSDDVVIVPAHGDPIVGKERAIDESRRALDEFQVEQSMSTDETVINADTAFVRGTSRGWKLDRETGTRQEFSEDYVAVLRQQCGKWRLTRLIWNDAPQREL